MSALKMTVFAALVLMTTAAGAAGDRTYRPQAWTLILVITVLAAYWRSAPPVALAVVATVPPMLAALVVESADAIVPALIFGVAFGLLSWGASSLGCRISRRRAAASVTP